MDKFLNIILNVLLGVVFTSVFVNYMNAKTKSNVAQKTSNSISTLAPSIDSIFNKKDNTAGGKAYNQSLDGVGFTKYITGYTKSVIAKGLSKKITVGTYKEYIVDAQAFRDGSLLKEMGEYDSNGNKVGLWYIFDGFSQYYLSLEEAYKNGKYKNKRPITKKAI